MCACIADHSSACTPLAPCALTKPYTKGAWGSGSPLPRSFKHAHPEMRAYETLYGLLRAHWPLSTLLGGKWLRTHSRASQGDACAFYRLLWGRSTFHGNARARVFSSVRGEQTRSWAQRAQERNWFLMGGEGGKEVFLRSYCGASNKG